MPRNYKVGDRVMLRPLEEFCNPYRQWSYCHGNGVASRHRNEISYYHRDLAPLLDREFVIAKLTYDGNSNFYTVKTTDGETIYRGLSDCMLRPAGSLFVPIVF